jgi:hypothetical protein
VLLSVEAQAQVSLQDWGRVESLAVGTEIFVKMKSGEKHKGALSRATGNELIFYAYQHGFSRDRYRRVVAQQEVKEVRLLARDLSSLAGAGIGAAAGAIKGAVGKKDEDESRTGKILKNVAVGGVLGAAAGKGVKNMADGRAMKANQGLSQHLYNTKENPVVKQKLLTAEEMSEEMVKEAMHKKGFRTVSLKKDECEGEPEKNYHSASEELEDLLKEAKMTVPDKKEAKKEQIPPDKQVASADPTDGEYLADIDCKECQYKGKPASDGTCPNCGALLGEKPKEPDNERDKPVGHNNQTQRSIEDTIAAHDSGNSMDSVD